MTCKREDTSPKPSGAEPLTTILITGNSGLDTAERVAIRDSVSWVKMWARLTGMQPIPQALPKVAFDSSVVVIAAAGNTSSGHSIRIDSAKVEGAELTIYVRETINEPCGPSDLMVRYPAHAVKVRRAAEAVRFVDDSMVTKCS